MKNLTNIVATLALSFFFSTSFAQSGDGGVKDGQGSGAHEALEAYPNPTPSGNVKLETDLKESTEVTFRIYDMSGVEVWSTTVYGSGNVLVDADITQVPSGTYIAEKTVDGVRVSTTVIRQ